MLDDLLEDVGSSGPFQWMIVIMIMSAKSIFGYSMLIMAFGSIKSHWWCVVEDEDIGSLNTTSPNYQMCNMTHSCSRVFEPYTWTVVSEFDLVCDNSWKNPTQTSIQMAGVLVGAFFGGQSGDTFGRKITIYLAILFHAIFNFTIAFSANWEMFAAFRFLIGFTIGAFLVIVVYPVEFIGSKGRTWASSFPFWPVGCCILSLASYLIHDWKYLHITCGILTVPYILGWFFVPESVRWLATKDRIPEALAVIETIAKYNGTKVPANAESVLRKLAEQEKEANSEKKYTYLDIYRGVYFLKTSLCIQLSWFSVSAIYYGFSFGVSNLAGSFYLNFFIMNVMEMPQYFPIVYFIQKIGRKFSASFALFIAATLCISILITQEVMDINKGPIITGLSLSARLSTAGGWVCLILLSQEIYPTVIRYIGYGAANTSARVGGILAPFIFSLGSSRMTPYIIMSSLMVTSGICILMLSETRGMALPDLMIKEAQQSKSQTKEKYISDTTNVVQEPITKDKEQSVMHM